MTASGRNATIIIHWKQTYHSGQSGRNDLIDVNITDSIVPDRMRTREDWKRSKSTLACRVEDNKDLALAHVRRVVEVGRMSCRFDPLGNKP
jgi:hypothetical protein